MSYVSYKMKDKLSVHMSSNDYETIYLCAFQINTSCKIPFLQYLLVNNHQGLGLDLFHLPYLRQSEEEIVLGLKQYLSNVCMSSHDDIPFVGFYEYNHQLYVFFDISHIEFPPANTLALIDEIVNTRKVGNVPVHPTATDFFVQNTSMLYLYDKQTNVYETPVVAFVGKSTRSKLEFTHMFGESPKDRTAMLGPYFYFTSYQHARLEGGVVRFALFVGKTKIIENMPNDPPDDSLTKQMRFKDPSVDQVKEKLLLRITDYDGKWAKEYDSIYLGNIELDDGTYMNHAPLLVLKDYHQQCPLSIV